MEEKSVAHPRNTADPHYREMLEASQKSGACIFCTKDLESGAVAAGKHWVLIRNDFPYSCTKHHFVIIYRKHIENLHELEPEAKTEFFDLIHRVVESLAITGGGIGIRFGNPEYSGVTTNHLHGHLIVPEETTFVNFPIGPMPRT